MKITRNTPDLLVIDHYPLLLTLALGGFMLLFAGVAFDGLRMGNWFLVVLMLVLSVALWFVIRIAATRVRLVFDRGTGLLTIRQKSTKGLQEWRHPLDTIGQARVATQQGESDTYRLEIHFASGMDAGFAHPVTESFSSDTRTHTAAKVINTWLAAVDSAPSRD